MTTHQTTHKQNKTQLISIFALFVIALLALAGCTQSTVTPVAQDNNSSPSASGSTQETQPATGIQYVSTNLEQCKVIKFVCVQGKEYFADDRGCGCKPITPQTTPSNETVGKQYVHLNTNESTCSIINFMCLNGMQAFVDNKGCGCEPVVAQKPVSTYCTDEQRNATICTADYNPVCGWFKENVKCFAYPCAQTASNGCEACQNANVDYYTNGVCPNPNATNDSVEGAPIQYINPNKACTMEYAPVCVVLSDNSKHTMGNSCEASNVKNVVSTTPGECQ